jgi:hypothetical protein
MSIISIVLVAVINLLSVSLSTDLSQGLHFGLIAGPDGPPSWWLSDALGAGWREGLNYIWLFAVSGGLLVGALGGGLTVLQHYILRLLLWRTHTFPLEVQTFLDDATARILLRHVGGGYSFTHRLLLDHFADLYTDIPSAQTVVPLTSPRSPA